EDHDDDGVKIAANAQKALAPVAGSSRIVPTEHLWKHLPKNARPLRPGDDVQDWLRLGGDPAKLLNMCHEIPIEDADPLLWAGEPHPRGRRKWRVRALMPAEGVGLLAGQWGFYKTFMAIELILSVIKTGQSFCGRSVVEPCGVLVLATEGAFE